MSDTRLELSSDRTASPWFRDRLRFVTMVGCIRWQSYYAAVAKTFYKLPPDHVSHLGSVGNIPHYNADLQAGGSPVEVLAMAEAIERSDGVVIVTSEYNYSVPRFFKSAIDWLSRLAPQPLAGKPIAIQSGCPGPVGGARAQYHPGRASCFWRGYVLNKPEIIIGGIAGKINSVTQELTDEATRDLIRRQLAALAALARRARMSR